MITSRITRKLWVSIYELWILLRLWRRSEFSIGSLREISHNCRELVYSSNILTTSLLVIITSRFLYNRISFKHRYVGYKMKMSTYERLCYHILIMQNLFVKIRKTYRLYYCFQISHMHFLSQAVPGPPNQRSSNPLAVILLFSKCNMVLRKEGTRRQEDGREGTEIEVSVFRRLYGCFHHPCTATINAALDERWDLLVD